MSNIEIPIWEKLNLTMREASLLSNIGEDTLREVITRNPELDFLSYVGRKVLLYRKGFEKWLQEQYIIR